MGLRQPNGLLVNRSPERQFRLPLGDWFTRERANSAAKGGRISSIWLPGSCANARTYYE
jgi:hypothetical protein